MDAYNEQGIENEVFDWIFESSQPPTHTGESTFIENNTSSIETQTYDWLTGVEGYQTRSSIAELGSGPVGFPNQVKREWARTARRIHHFLWHYFRDGGEWRRLPASIRRQATESNWRPSRFTGQPGAGLDFLYMHRLMIRDTRRLLSRTQQLYAVGWNPIPWNHSDPTWPMPVWPPPQVGFKTLVETQRWRRAVQRYYQQDSWLRTVTLDQLGTELERGIHGWMHMHWSMPQPTTARILGNRVSDDWLGHPYSSHVNPAFWKLHGWIDDRINQWERATGRRADFRSAWLGPFPHTATPARAAIRATEARSKHRLMRDMRTLFNRLDRRRVIAFRFPAEPAAAALERLQSRSRPLVS